MEALTAIKTSTLTLRLNEREAEELKGIREILNVKTSSETIKKLIKIYPLYLMALDEIKTHLQTIRQQDARTELKNNEINGIKNKIRTFTTLFNEFQDM